MKSTPCTSRTWPPAGHRPALRRLRRQHDLGQRQPDAVLRRAGRHPPPWHLCRYPLGGDVPPTVFDEPDGRFFLHCYRTSSERQLVLLLGSKTTSEAWVLDAEQPQAPFTCLAPRSKAMSTMSTMASSMASGPGSSAATRRHQLRPVPGARHTGPSRERLAGAGGTPRCE